MDVLRKNIAETRHRLGLTQEDLAKKIGVAKSTISGYEAGHRQPDPETIFKIATALDVTMDYLFGLEGKWISALPPELQRFVTVPENHIYLYVARKLKESSVRPETIVGFIELLMRDAKKRLKPEEEGNSPE